MLRVKLNIDLPLLLGKLAQDFHLKFKVMPPPLIPLLMPINPLRWMGQLNQQVLLLGQLGYGSPLYRLVLTRLQWLYGSLPRFFLSFMTAAPIGLWDLLGCTHVVIAPV